MHTNTHFPSGKKARATADLFVQNTQEKSWGMMTVQYQFLFFVCNYPPLQKIFNFTSATNSKKIKKKTWLDYFNSG